MDDFEGTPLVGELDGPQCDHAPHFYLVEGDIAEKMNVLPLSEQHCCMDHGGGACFGWVCLSLDSIVKHGEVVCLEMRSLVVDEE